MENSNEYRELLIGCGSRKEKDIQISPYSKWQNLTTLDIMESHNPDIVWDLNMVPLPFDANEFNEIHAYEVLEHCGKQGDYKFFFAQFSDFWRILKPKGLLCGSVPTEKSVWAWGDPGHTRIITSETLYFLVQRNYDQIGKTTMSDYRSIYSADFEIRLLQIREATNSLLFVLEAVK